VEAWLHIFLTPAPVGGVWPASILYRFNPGEGPRYPLDKTLLGPRAGLDAVAYKKNPFLASAGNQTSVIQPVA